MQLKITVNSVANDCEYGGEQIISAERGEYRLEEIFRLPFFRIIIDDIIEGSLCFRLMEGGVAHFFVLDENGNTAKFHRDTSLGEDDFTFELILEDK
ncbi:MAG: hypothetical protein K2O89_00415 [Clostridia bacterium]|nr:hypothetical protein [Clostridia bacterium]